MSSTDLLPYVAEELSIWLADVLLQAGAARHRRLLLLAGEAPWCRHAAQQIIRAGDLSRVCWISTQLQVAAEVMAPGAATQLLGQERDALVFDAHSGFDPDAFAAVSGVIRGGGLMLLLCPPLDQWPAFADPAAQRIAVWPHGFADIHGRFLQRIARIVGATDSVIRIAQGEALPAVRKLPPAQAFAEIDDPIYRTLDQRAAVTAIGQVLHCHRQRPLVLEADRGRGKSSALGIAAAGLLQDSPGLNIVVTAPRPAAVQPLFDRARQHLPEAKLRQGHLQWQAGSIQYVAPDVLCLQEVPADLLLVDEAAAIPAGLLRQILGRYSRVVFSTTTHGYEGTGRGFALRFKQTLDEQTPGWRQCQLHAPIRWAQGDPLETLVFNALLLDAAAAEDDTVAEATVDAVVLDRIPRDTLLHDESLLSQLFGLLVVAHYRTRPNDLRNLLDGPGLSVYVSRYQGQVVATALVAREGGFTTDITEDIYAGRRRPRGHLIPQSLVTHVGLKDAGALRCARILRMAVHPALQRHGFGRQLLQRVIRDAQAEGLDMLGVSFGATPSLVDFWASENLLAVRMGFRRDHASGEYSVMMLRPLSDDGAAVCTAARARFVQDLPLWLADPLQALDTGLAANLLQADDGGAVLPEGHDHEMLQSFIRGERSYEDALGPIWRLMQTKQVRSTVSVNNEDKQVLQAKVLQRQSWMAVAKHFGLAGRTGVLACLRRCVAGLLDTTPAVDQP